MRRLLASSVCALAASITASTSAATLTFDFEGVVTFVNPAASLSSSIPLGAPFSGFYRFDPTVSDQSWGSTDPSTGTYPQAWTFADYQFQVGGYSFEIDPFWGFAIVTGNEWTTPPHDEYIVAGRLRSAALPYQHIDVRWELAAASPGPLADDSLPPRPPLLSEWDRNELRVEDERCYVCAPAFQIRGVVTRIVPEPSSFSLLALALGMMRLRTVGKEMA